MPLCVRFGPLALVVAIAIAVPAVAEQPAVDFARQILPILSDKCFVCHGPDAGSQSDLRLDSAAAATTDLGGYQAIDPDDPAASEILVRIHSADDPMPPSEAERQLSDQERELLTRWVRAGGRYEQHWAFRLPRKPESLPDAPSMIDWFIGNRLSQRGIDFAPSADRPTLARRLALVLTGLPPEPQQLERFLAEDSQASYLQLVDELMSSPRFGEHQARYWLDAVRYGDTHGLHLDNRRGIYPYRDWVVRAFNDNLPLDQFISWQIAGDLLPRPTLAQQVATGFVRLNPSTGEGGAIPAEFQMKNNFDRVETLGTALLGMSLTCARCHTHKYDPIPQTDYYRLLAFFNSTAEPALDGNSYTYGPVARVPANQAAWSQWNQLERERDRLLREAAESIPEVSELISFANQRRGWRSSDWKISPPLSLGTTPAQWSKASGLPGALSGRAARGKLPGAEQAVSVSFRVKVPIEQHLQLTFSGAPGSHVMLDEANVPIAEKTNEARVLMTPIRLSAGWHDVQVVVVGAAETTELEIRIDNPWDALVQQGDWESVAASDQLRMLADASGPLGRLSLQGQAANLASQITAAESNFTTSLVAQELPTPRVTQLLHRGEYDQPVGDSLQPGVLSILGGLDPQAPANRLGLAQWLTSPSNPLVSRVLVNRIWARTFGYPLVRSPEDFGLQGRQPTHPELLDWLAVELRQSGWDFKHMLRLMVTSRTFAQDSAWREGIDDPENLLFARGARYRLDAEVLRDIGLWASGLLDTERGGEGVKPYQPAGMWLALAHPASNTKNYVPDQGQRLYRRSLYLYWKRTSPHPMMTLFDAPDRESSCVRRSRTDTPLQSLGLLNETQRVEMSRKLAERLVREKTSDALRIDLLFGLLACRDATPPERDACLGLLQQIRQRYSRAPGDAQALLAVGNAAADSSLSAAEVAAWTQVAIVVLASDAALLIY